MKRRRRARRARTRAPAPPPPRGSLRRRASHAHRRASRRRHRHPQPRVASTPASPRARTRATRSSRRRGPSPARLCSPSRRLRLDAAEPISLRLGLLELPRLGLQLGDELVPLHLHRGGLVGGDTARLGVSRAVSVASRRRRRGDTGVTPGGGANLGELGARVFQLSPELGRLLLGPDLLVQGVLHLPLRQPRARDGLVLGPDGLVALAPRPLRGHGGAVDERLGVLPRGAFPRHDLLRPRPRGGLFARIDRRRVPLRAHRRRARDRLRRGGHRRVPFGNRLRRDCLRPRRPRRPLVSLRLRAFPRSLGLGGDPPRGVQLRTRRVDLRPGLREELPQRGGFANVARSGGVVGRIRRSRRGRGGGGRRSRRRRWRRNRRGDVYRRWLGRRGRSGRPRRRDVRRRRLRQRLERHLPRRRRRLRRDGDGWSRERHRRGRRGSRRRSGRRRGFCDRRRHGWSRSGDRGRHRERGHGRRYRG